MLRYLANIQFLTTRKYGLPKERAMKKTIIFFIAAGLLLIPFIHQVQSAQHPASPPPVSSVLVRQGDFALSLLEVFDLGTAFSETQAQNMLSDLGIEPINGWIADYPMTPDIVGELQDAVVRASDYGYLTMSRSEVLTIFQTLTADYGLPIIPDYTGTRYDNTPPTFGSYRYIDPTVINNYYHHRGPPIITYYPPPYGYYHHYSWVPYPFWWGSFRFSGYFVLNDFHRTSHVVILHRYGNKKYYRGPARGIGVVSNRSKRFHRHRSVVVPPSDRKHLEYAHPGVKTGKSRWSESYESGTRDRYRYLKDDQKHRRPFRDNTVIRRGYNRPDSTSSDPSNQRFRGDTNRNVNNPSSGIPPRVNRRIDRGTNSHQVMGNNPSEMRRPGNSRGSINGPHIPSVRDNRNPAVRQNRSNKTVREERNPAVRQDRSNKTVREERNPAVHQDRKRFDRTRSYEGTRSFQGRDFSNFQRPDRNRQGATRPGQFQTSK